MIGNVMEKKQRKSVLVSSLGVGMVASVFITLFFMPATGTDPSDLSHEVNEMVPPKPDHPQNVVEDLAEEKDVKQMMMYSGMMEIPLERQDCTEQFVAGTDVNGEYFETTICEPNLPPPHPYAAYDTEVLREMAYRDSEAAEILSIKLIEDGKEAEGLEFVYRAVALTGGRSLRAIFRAHSTFYRGLDINIDPGGSDEIALVYPDVERAYVFDRIGEVLQGREESMRSHMEEHGYKDFDRLDKEASEALSRMATVEQEVVGSRFIREKIDV